MSGKHRGRRGWGDVILYGIVAAAVLTVLAAVVGFAASLRGLP